MSTSHLGRLSTRWTDDFTPCEHVEEGETVVAPFQGGIGIRCKVITAAGFHARVSNPRYEFDKWFHVSDLAREKHNQ